MTPDPSVTDWRAITTGAPTDATSRQFADAVHAACTGLADLETRADVAEATNVVLTEIIYALLHPSSAATKEPRP